jgi:hypothetical protein
MANFVPKPSKPEMFSKNELRGGVSRAHLEILANSTSNELQIRLEDDRSALTAFWQTVAGLIARRTNAR